MVGLLYSFVNFSLQEQTTRKLKQETTAKQHKLDMLRNIINQDGDSGSVVSRQRITGRQTCRDDDADYDTV